MAYNFSISYTNIIDFNPDYTKEKVVVETFQTDNLLMLAQKFKNTEKMYQELLKNDFILYFHEKDQSYFCKRYLFEHLWKRKDLIKEGSLFFTIDEQNENKMTTLQRKKLLVIFSCMPTMEKYNSHTAAERCFVPFFPSIARSLVKDVLIMRIMDLNLSHGSHYISTENYPEMENDIQNAIKKVAFDHLIDVEDIVLYGISKGGTGALYHGALADYNVLAVDPILSVEEYNQDGNQHFLKNLRRIDLTDDLNRNLEKCSRKKIIISNENITFNYKKINELTVDKVNLVSIQDNTVNHHTELSKNTIPEQLSLLNGLFSENFSIH